MTLNPVIKTADISRKLLKALKKKFETIIILAKNEIKDIIKAIESLENREIILKVSAWKTTSQEWGFLNFLKPLMTVDLPLIKNVLTPLVKSALIPLGLWAAASATDAAIQKKICESDTTALKVSNEEMEDIMKIIKSPEESGLLIKGISVTLKNEVKEQKGELLGMLLGTLGASVL